LDQNASEAENFLTENWAAFCVEYFSRWWHND